MTMLDYKNMHGLDRIKGILPDDLREHKAKMVFANNTVLNLEKGKRTRFKKGKPVPAYERSAQTLARLRKLHTYKHDTK